ncbi:MAG TPA: methyltransferase [Candidatus Binatia bacterium]|nr:methyltransferase [Candidatus Binatia bacterium]
MTHPACDERPLWDLLFGHLGFRALLVAHQLGLFEALAAEPRTLRELCEALGVERRAARALVAPCVACGLLEARDGLYELAPVAREYLVAASPSPFAGFLDMLIANEDVFSTRAVRAAVEQNASQVFGGDPLFASLEQQTALAHAFTRGMHGHSAGAARAWPELVELSAHRVLLDVAGGSGVHAVAAARRWPHLSAIVLDRPAVLEVAREVVADADLADRVAVHGADVWSDPFPSADLHFYADVFHDWPPEKGRFLARKSFESLPAGGTIVVHEMLFDEDKHRPLAAAAYNLAMLVWTEGQQYSGRELVALLAEAGFQDVRARPALGYWSVVTGRKP